MKEVQSNPDLVAYCGLYCGACGSYLKDKCPGCHDNEKASWCKIRVCCMDNEYLTCADCNDFESPSDCRKFNNWLSKIFSLIFRSDRAACIQQIKDIGIQGHTDKMTEQKRQSIKK